MSSGNQAAGGSKAPGSVIRSLLRYLIVAALIASVFLEGYYIKVLRDTIKTHTEEMRSISVQLQLLRNERDKLNEEIVSARKQSGDKNNGNPEQR